MQTHVHVVIDLKVIFGDIALVEQGIALHQASLKRVARVLRQPALGHLPRRKPFQNATHVNRPGDLLRLIERT